jgi:hypothetical protein
MFSLQTYFRTSILFFFVSSFVSFSYGQGQGELIDPECAVCHPDGLDNNFFQAYWTSDQPQVQSSGQCEWRCEGESISFDKSTFCNPNKPISGTVRLMKLISGQGYIDVGTPQSFSFDFNSSTGPHVFQLDQSDPTGTYRLHLEVSYGDEFCDEGFIDPLFCVEGIAGSESPMITVNGIEISMDADNPTYFCGSAADFSDAIILLENLNGSGQVQIFGELIQGQAVCNRTLPQFYDFGGSVNSYPATGPDGIMDPCDPFTAFDAFPEIFRYTVNIEWENNPCNHPSEYSFYQEFEPIDAIIEYDYILPTAVNFACNGSMFSGGTAPADVSVPGPSLGESSVGITNGSSNIQNATMTDYSVFIITGSGEQVYSSLNNVATELPYTFQPMSHVANPGFVDGNPNFFQLHSGLSPAECADDPFCTDGVQYFITVEINTSECGSLTRTTPFTICQTCNFCFQAPTPTRYSANTSLEDESNTKRFSYNNHTQTISINALRIEQSFVPSKFVITNVLGQEVVLRGEVNSSQQSWDVSPLRNGIYVVTVFSEGEASSQILVK